MIAAVTFDFWNTLYADQAELERERDRLRVGLLEEATGRDGAAIRDALDRTRERWYEVWRRDGRTLTEAESIEGFTAFLGVEVGHGARRRVRAALQEAALEVPPRPIPGALAALREVAALFPVALVSDTGFTPGRVLRELMRRDGVGDLFRATSFSDETGFAKPSPAAFAPALAALGVPAERVVHIGDLLETDVRGARACGMRAVWLRTAGAAAPPGDAGPHGVVGAVGELLPLIESWAA